MNFLTLSLSIAIFSISSLEIFELTIILSLNLPFTCTIISKVLSIVFSSLYVGQLEYTSELEVVKKLLPEPVNESQVCSELSEWCRENHFTQRFQTAIGYEEYLVIPKKEMGNAIKHLKSKFPQADGKLISIIVKSFIV